MIGGKSMKRSNGEGTIFKRKDGRWCAAYYDEGPVPKRHFVYGKTQAEVKRKLKEIDRTAPQKSSGADGDKTLAEWIFHYIENYKKNEVKKTTYDTYQVYWRKHIKKDRIGKIKLEKISSDALQRYYNEKLSEGYNVKTVKHIRVIINSALEQAVKLRLIRENVNRFTTLPKKSAYEAGILSIGDVQKILKEAREEELYPIVVFTMYTGLRKGEVMALKWSNIDWERKELSVEGSLCRIEAGIGENGKMKHDYQIMEPKTRKSRRTIPILDIAAEALVMQRERQEVQKEIYADIYQDEDFIFARCDGRYLDQRGFMDEYHAFLKKYSLPEIRFHDLRHTFASLLLEAGESPKVIQELLGHTNISTTMDIYAHVSNQAKRRTINRLDSLLEMDSEDV